MTAAPPARETIETLRKLYSEISNWGRWGVDDQRGTLNLIGPDERRRGLATVTEGLTMSCARPVVTEASEHVTNAAALTMITAGDVAPAVGFGQARDRFSIAPHGATHTHLDALCHVFFDGRMYNNRPAAATTSRGATVNDLSGAVAGIVTRGVLLDIPAVRGTSYVSVDEPVLRTEIEEAERRTGAFVRPGDAVLVRVGREVRAACEGAGCERVDGRATLPGLAPDCLRWLRERDVALLVSDAAHNAIPNDTGVSSPVHVGALVYLGLHLVDNAALDELAETCAREGRWEFAFTVAPLPVRGSTGSPVNPLVLF